MAYQSIWYFTDLPKDVVEILDKDLYDNFNNQMQDSKLHGDALDKVKRNSKNTWIPTTHWISGFLWHYVQKANRENFLYDLSHIDAEKLQYTRYEKGEYYNWHKDTGSNDHMLWCQVGCSILLESECSGGATYYKESGKIIEVDRDKLDLIAHTSNIVHKVDPPKGYRLVFLIFI